MKRKTSRLRLSPNEEARIIREEQERRRKLRLQQVREQQRCIALQIRREVEQRRQQELRLLEDELRLDWEQQQRDKLLSLHNLYQESLKLLGQGHRSAKENEPDLAAIAQQEEENHTRAERRYREALKELKSQKIRDHERLNQPINARKKALQAEKERSAKVASLPPPPPDPLQIINTNKPRIVRRTDVSAFAATHYHMPESVVDREVDTQQPSAAEGAEVEERRQQDFQRDEQRRREEQLEKARLRGKQALRREQLVQDRERLLVELEHMQQTDLLRRRQQVTHMPAQIFQPLYMRQETREDFQREMEFAFEDMYTGERRVKGDLVVRLVPEPLPAASPGSQDQELDVTLDDADTPESDNTQCEAEQESPGFEQETSAEAPPSRPPPRQALRRLLDRIRNQRNQITDLGRHDPTAVSPSGDSDQIPERDSTIETGSLLSERHKVTPVELHESVSIIHSDGVNPAEEARVPPAAVDSRNVLAVRVQEFEEKRKRKEEELEREKQQQLATLQELEEQKAKLEQMLLEAERERERLKAAVTQQEEPRNQPEEKEEEKEDITSVNSQLPTERLRPANEDEHARRIKEYQQRLLEQNRVHQRSVEVARQRLEEYQRALRIRYSTAAALLLPAVVPAGRVQSHLLARSQLPAEPGENLQTSVDQTVGLQSASPPRLPGLLLSDQVETVSDGLGRQWPDVTAFLTRSIMERVTEHLPQRLRPPSLLTEPTAGPLLQPARRSLQDLNRSEAHGASPIPEGRHGASTAPGEPLLRGGPSTGEPLLRDRPLSSTEAVMEAQRWERQILDERKLMLQQRHFEEELREAQRQELQEPQRRELQEAQWQEAQRREAQRREAQRRDLQEAQQRELQEAQRQVFEQREALMKQQRQQEEELREAQRLEFQEAQRRELQEAQWQEAQRRDLQEAQQRELQEAQRQVLEQREALMKQQRQQEEERRQQELKRELWEAQEVQLQEVQQQVMEQQRQQEEEQRQQELHREQMRRQKETLQALINTDTQSVPVSGRTTPVSDSLGQNRLRLLSTLLRAIEESHGGTLSHLEASKESESSAPQLLRDKAPVAQSDAPTRGPPPVSSALPPGLVPPPQAPKPPVTRVRLGFLEMMAEQHELSVIREVDTPLNGSQAAGPEDSVRVPSHGAEAQERSDAALVSADSHLQTSCLCSSSSSSSRQQTEETTGSSEDSSEPSTHLTWRERLLMGAGTSPELSDCDSVQRIISTLSSHSGREAHVSVASITSCRSFRETPLRAADSDCLSSTISTGSYITTSPEQNLPTEKPEPSEQHVDRSPAASSPPEQRVCVRESPSAGRPAAAVDLLFNDSSIQRIIDRYTRELDLSLSAAGRTADGDGSYVDAADSLHSSIRASKSRGEDKSSSARQSDASAARSRPPDGDASVRPSPERLPGDDPSPAEEQEQDSFRPLIGQPADQSSCLAADQRDDSSWEQLVGRPSAHSSMIGPPPGPDGGGWDSTLSQMIGRLSGQSGLRWPSGGRDLHVWPDEASEESRMRPLVGELDESAGQISGSSGERSLVIPSLPPLPGVPTPRRSVDVNPPDHIDTADRTGEFPDSESFHPLQAEVTHNNSADASVTFHPPGHGDTAEESAPSPERLRADEAATGSWAASSSSQESFGGFLGSPNPPQQESLAPIDAWPRDGEKGILEQSEITLVSLSDTTLPEQESTISQEEEEEGEEGEPTEKSDSQSSPGEDVQSPADVVLEGPFGPGGVLQEAQQKKLRALLLRSKRRVEEVKAKGARSKTRPEKEVPPEASSKDPKAPSNDRKAPSDRPSKTSSRSQRGPAERTAVVQKNPLPPPPDLGGRKAAEEEEVRTCTPEQRKRELSSMRQRTRRLYEQLEEVKQQRAVRSRQEDSAKNRLKAREFHEKTLQKLRAKQT